MTLLRLMPSDLVPSMFGAMPGEVRVRVFQSEVVVLRANPLQPPDGVVPVVEVRISSSQPHWFFNMPGKVSAPVRTLTALPATMAQAEIAVNAVTQDHRTESLARRIVDGYDAKWCGRSFVGELDQDATDALNELVGVIDDAIAATAA